MVDFIEEFELDLAEQATRELNEAIEACAAANSAANAILEVERDTLATVTELSGPANDIVVLGARIVRSVFGSKSPQYRAVMSRDPADDGDIEDIEAEAAEDVPGLADEPEATE